MSKIAILIDGMYLQNALRLFGLNHLDYEKKLPKKLMRDGESMFREYYFDALPYVPKVGGTEGQIARRDGKKRFMDGLRFREGIVVEEGVVKPRKAICYKCNNEYYVTVQKGVDVKMSVRLMSLAFSNPRIVEKIILLAGDSDLIPAVDAAEGSGTTIRLAYFTEGNVQTSPDLISKCPEKHPLTRDDLIDCLLS